MGIQTLNFEASEDIMTKFKSQGLHIIRIKYWNASGTYLSIVYWYSQKILYLYFHKTSAAICDTEKIVNGSVGDSNLVIISSLDSKWQGLKVGMLVFQLFSEMKLKTSKFKVLAFWGQCRYHVATLPSSFLPSGT